MKLLPFIAGTLFLAACFGSAQVHYQDTHGGVLSLSGAQDKAMESAHQQMAMHCGPGNYQVVKQERVVVGQETNNYHSEQQDEVRDRQRQGYGQASAESGRDRYGEYAHVQGSSQEAEQERGRTNTEAHSQSVTTDVTEFRIHYQCGHGDARATAPLR